MGIKAIFFDFFGVISTEVAPFWFAERFSAEEAARLKDEYMTPADRGDLTEEAIFSRLSELSGESAEAICADFKSRVKIDRNMVALALSLKERYKTVLVSNAMWSWLDNILKDNGIESIFDKLVISSEEHAVKPEREIFETALRRAGVGADEAIFIDDNPKNVKGAEAVGIKGLVFKDADTLKRELTALGITV